MVESQTGGDKRFWFECSTSIDLEWPLFQKIDGRLLQGKSMTFTKILLLEHIKLFTCEVSDSHFLWFLCHELCNMT